MARHSPQFGPSSRQDVIEVTVTVLYDLLYIGMVECVAASSANTMIYLAVGKAINMFDKSKLIWWGWR